jgi:uncharacterized protein (DUF433 family)
MEAQAVGKYIVIDPEICHGKPTFRGTRIMVWQVLEMVGKGVPWDEILWQCHGSIPREAISEAVQLASKALADQARAYNSKSVSA